MGLIRKIIGIRKPEDWKYNKALKKQIKEKELEDKYGNMGAPTFPPQYELSNNEKIWVRNHNTEDPELVQNRYKIKISVQTIYDEISSLNTLLISLKKKNKKPQFDKQIEKIISTLASFPDLNTLINSVENDDLKFMENYENIISEIDELVHQLGNKKIIFQFSELKKNAGNFPTTKSRLKQLATNSKVIKDKFDLLNKQTDVKSDEADINLKKGSMSEEDKLDKQIAIAQKKKELLKLQKEIKDLEGDDPIEE